MDGILYRITSVCLSLILLFGSTILHFKAWDFPAFSDTDDTSAVTLVESAYYLPEMRRSAIRLSRLINDIIDFQSLQNNSLPFQKERFDVNGAVRVALEVLQYLKKKR